MLQIINNDIRSVLNKDKDNYILFFFTASWCGPCKKIYPLMEKISEGSDKEKLMIYKNDIDDNDELSTQLKIKSVPTFYLYHKDKYVNKCSGGNIEKVKKLLKENMIK